MKRFKQMLDRLVWVGMFDGRFEDQAHAIAVFNRFNDQVKRTIPPDRLLVYDVKQGWGPLCDFLGVPVPEGKTFPHLNDTAEFRARIDRASRVVRGLGYAGLTIVALLAGWVALRLLG